MNSWLIMYFRKKLAFILRLINHFRRNGQLSRGRLPIFEEMGDGFMDHCILTENGQLSRDPLTIFDEMGN